VFTFSHYCKEHFSWETVQPFMIIKLYPANDLLPYIQNEFKDKIEVYMGTKIKSNLNCV